MQVELLSEQSSVICCCPTDRIGQQQNGDKVRMGKSLALAQQGVTLKMRCDRHVVLQCIGLHALATVSYDMVALVHPS